MIDLFLGKILGLYILFILKTKWLLGLKKIKGFFPFWPENWEGW